MKSDTVSTFPPSICHEVIGPDAMIFVFWMLNFKPAFPLSYFTFIKRLFSSSPHAAAASVVSDSVRPHRWQPTRLLHPWDSPGKNTGVGCHFLLQCMKVKSESEVTQSCLTPSDPMDCSLPGSSIHGVFQARVLEWGAIIFTYQPLKCMASAYLAVIVQLPTWLFSAFSWVYLSLSPFPFHGKDNIKFTILTIFKCTVQ